MTLEAFLSDTAAQMPAAEYAASARFTADGEPVKWKLRCISAAEDDVIRRSCVRPAAGRSGQNETDYSAYVEKFTAAAVVYPNLNSKELQDSYHVYGAGPLLKAMLTAGEYQALARKVQMLCDFDLAQQVETAKN